MSNTLFNSEESIKEKIFTIRNLKVMIDSDLVELYNIPVKTLNQAVKRNIERFPDNFMFQLTEEESKNLRLQIATSSISILRSQFVTLEKGKGAHRKYLPYTFTEQGVAMLSGVLRNGLHSQDFI